MNLQQIWIVDDDKTMRWVLEQTLSQAGFSVQSFSEAQTALDVLAATDSTTAPTVIVSDIRMPGIDGLEFLSQVKALYPNLPVIIMTAHSDLESAVASYQTGAFEYLPKPFDIDDALALVNRAVAHAAKMQHSTPDHPTVNTPQVPDIIGESPAMQDVFRAIGRLAQSHITVLINGESGTGKELVAHALHRHSPRQHKPFIALNMAAIPKDLIETELFGHEKGAFTGANTQRQGRFEQANGGTLFLDEIGDMPFETQTRLLRVLADGEFYRVGGHVPVKVNVRIVAATHQDLEKLAAEGKFREDLYHRLNVIRIHIPKLAERREDIERLAQHFLARAAKELAVSPKILQPETVAFLQQLPWRGNVRQLENLCRWLTVMVTAREIYLDDLPVDVRQQLPVMGNTAIETSSTTTSITAHGLSIVQEPAVQPTALPSHHAPNSGNAWMQPLAHWAAEQLEQGNTKLLDYAAPLFEKILLEAALHYTHGRKRHAAELLGWGRNTLTRKLKELGIEDDESADDDRNDQNV